jgi:hypothetical protein
VLALSIYALIAPPALLCVNRLCPLPVARCLFATLADRPCPFCGLTRGILAALRGDVERSALQHPLALPTLASLCTEVLWRSLLLAAGRRWEGKRTLARVDAVAHLTVAAGYAGYIAGFWTVAWLDRPSV